MSVEYTPVPAPPPPYAIVDDASFYHEVQDHAAYQIQQYPHFQTPGPPPPLPSASIGIPKRSLVHPIPPIMDENPWADQQSYAPSTSSGSTSIRRPLPPPPTHGHSQGTSISTRPADIHRESLVAPPPPFIIDSPHLSQYLPPPSNPPSLAPPQSTRPPIFSSPERENYDLPPTPSTSGSGQRFTSQHQSYLNSSGSLSPIRSPASFETAELPPWAVPFEPGPLSQNNTLTPETVQRGGSGSGGAAQIQPQTQTFLRVNVNPDPGHVVSCKHFDLHLHKGDDHTAPVYGRGEAVEGYIDLKSRDHVSEIEVTLRGHLQVVFSAQGMAYDNVDVPLFAETKKLYTAAFSGALMPSHSFSLEFPQNCTASNQALPPSWVMSQPGVNAEVTYTIHAVVKRKGMTRRNAEATAKVEYFPRNAPPPDTQSPSEIGPPQPKLRLLEINCNLPPMGRSGADKPMVPTQFKASVLLHRPLIYASGSKIQFTVHLSSPVHTTVPASLDLEVTLVKISEVYLHRKKYDKKQVIATGTIKERRAQLGVSDIAAGALSGGTEGTQEGSTSILSGYVRAARSGEEMSWTVKGVATVKYVLRFVVLPNKQLAEFSTFHDTLPHFEHSEEIILTTDSFSTLLNESAASRPAVGLRANRTRTNTTPVSPITSPAAVVETPVTAGTTGSSTNLNGGGAGGGGGFFTARQRHSVRPSTSGSSMRPSTSGSLAR